MRLDLMFAFAAFILLCLAIGWLTVARRQKNRGRRSGGGFDQF